MLLGGAYLLGSVNRRREGGWPVALYARSGIAGAAALGFPLNPTWWVPPAEPVLGFHETGGSGQACAHLLR